MKLPASAWLSFAIVLAAINLLAGCTNTVTPDGTKTTRVDGKTVALLLDAGVSGYERVKAAQQPQATTP